MLKDFKISPVMIVLIGGLMLAGAGFAFAKGTHRHNAGLQLLGNKINTDGKHELHKAAGHTVYAHVKNKKIEKVSVTGPKGDVPVKKYKSSKKMAFLADPVLELIVRVSSNQIAQAGGDYIGYAFVDPVTGDTYIYWYPADVVIDTSGAEIYIAPV